jgi:hypothetical protein
LFAVPVGANAVVVGVDDVAGSGVTAGTLSLLADFAMGNFSF